VALGLALSAGSASAQATRVHSVSVPAESPRAGHFWRAFAAGFASSILAHEGGHVVAALAMGARPSFGLDAGRPTVYSGIDAVRNPERQFVFSAAGLTVQTLVDELVLDVPHQAETSAGPFERGVLAGGIATTLFYITLGRTGSVSDVDYMARTSSLSKAQITAIYGGAAALHVWRIAHDHRYARFFAHPQPMGGMRLGVTIEGF